jgi:hypothetical protein
MSKILTVYNWGSKLKKSFDRSDVILTTLIKFRLPKNGSSQQGDDNRDETNDTTFHLQCLSNLSKLLSC